MPTWDIMSVEEAEKIEAARRSLAAHAERMRLRDQFAAAALTALAHPEDCQAGPVRMELVCAMAFAWADAMLAARC